MTRPMNAHSALVLFSVWWLINRMDLIDHIMIYSITRCSVRVERSCYCVLVKIEFNTTTLKTNGDAVRCSN